MTQEFTATRTMLANAMATAGAELLQYMKTAGALAAIPNTDPQQYVVAGTLEIIGKLLPAVAPAVQAQAELTDANELREIAVILEREGYRMNAMKLRQIALRSAAGSASPAAADKEAELERIAVYWEDQARKGCADAFQCGLREAWETAALSAPSSNDVRSAAREQARNEALEEAALFLEAQTGCTEAEARTIAIVTKLIRYLKRKEAGYGALKTEAPAASKGGDA